MNETQQELRRQTEKWLEKLDGRLEELSGEEVEQMENVYAYRDDTTHFLEEEDFIRAWESVVYAWGILETLERLGKLG
ncbi:MAG: DUF357 domain-containing protein [Candidatus Nanohaloarchaea archaeon]